MRDGGQDDILWGEQDNGVGEMESFLQVTFKTKVIFKRSSRNLANVNIVRRDGEGVGDGNQDARSRNI